LDLKNKIQSAPFSVITGEAARTGPLTRNAGHWHIFQRERGGR
jgi:hypothetical protein